MHSFQQAPSTRCLARFDPKPKVLITHRLLHTRKIAHITNGQKMGSQVMLTHNETLISATDIHAR